MNDLKTGRRFTLRVDRLSTGGDAIGRAGAAVVFVPHGCPGDTLEVEVTEVRSNFCRARLLRVLEPSPVRITPPCPYHFSPSTSALHCGGCSWQHMTYPFQLDAKRQIVQETLERLGGIREVTVKPTLGMQDPWRYRNKVQQPVGWDGRRIISGFYAPFSHDIVPIEDCLVQSPLSVRILNRTRALLEQFHLQAYDERRHSGWIRHLWIRTSSENKALLVLVTRSEDFPHGAQIVETLVREFPELVGVHQNVNPGKTNVILGRQWRNCGGSDYLEERLGRLRFQLSPGSFFQVNTPQTVVLYDEVKRMASKGQTLLDLYCGVGGIALWLAPVFKQVIGVDEVKNAIIDAQNNARLNDIQNTRFVASPAEKFMSNYRASDETTVILDPPRAGCEPRVLQGLGHLRPALLIYVSCDPGTLARDLALLGRTGFKVQEVQPVDLFPHTAHIETVVRLTKAR